MATDKEQLGNIRNAIRDHVQLLLDEHPEWEGKFGHVWHEGRWTVGICFCEFTEE